MAGKTQRIGKSLIAIQEAFGTEEQCIEFLENLRWPDGVTCLKCGHENVEKFTVAESKRKKKYVSQQTGKEHDRKIPERTLYRCLKAECGHQFSVTTGTLFNDTHLPLNTWMLGTALMCNAKKGVSAKQLQRDLGVAYRTAWYLSHRIREAMQLGNWTDEKMSGTIEVDETYIGGKFDKRRKRAKYDKPAVFGMIERETGRVHARHLSRGPANQWQIGQQIDAIASPEAHMMTDESRLYQNLTRRGFEHDIVIHSDKEWVRGEVHTQSIDGFWGLVKRGLIGSFHQVSIKHLDRYVQEFQYRFNGRQNQELFTLTVAALALGIPLPYAKLVGDNPIVRNKKGVNQFTALSSDSNEADSSDEPF